MSARSRKETKHPDRSGATVGYESELWRMANALRGSMDAAGHKLVVLGPSFLKGGKVRTCLSITSRNLAKMNLAIRGIDGRIEQGDTFLSDRFPDLKADTNCLLKNPHELPITGYGIGTCKSEIHPSAIRNWCDYVPANAPFNRKEWGGERLRQDKRWKFGVPPMRNANFAWVQHMVHHLAPAGVAGFVLANGSMAFDDRGEGTNYRQRKIRMGGGYAT